MGSLSENIHAAFAQAQVSERLQAASQAKAEATQARWALARAQGQVTTWDKLNVLTTSPAEAALAQAQAAWEEAEARQRRCEGELDEALKGVAARFPPVGLWQQIEQVERLARTSLEPRWGLNREKVRKPQALLDALHALAKELLALYAPDFDLDGVLGGLRDEARCQRIALAAEGLVRRDERQGWGPLLREQLEGLVAGRLLESGFFAGEAELRALAQEEAERKRELEEARAKVGTWADLNVFSDSPEEAERNERLRLAQEARARRVAKDEAQQLELRSALDAHPPLALHRQLGAVLGVVDKLHAVQEGYLHPNGEAGAHHVVAPRALLLESIRQLRRVFLKVFESFPMPKTRQLGAQGAGWMPRNQLLLEFSEGMERREARALLDEGLRQAEALYLLQHQRRALDRSLGLVSKMMFWSSDPKVERAALVERRARERGEALLASWHALLGQAHEVAQGIAPLRVRDLAVRAALHARAIGTSSGCSVSQERAKAVARFEELRLVMGAAYGLRGDRRSFMADVARSSATNAPGAPLDPTVFQVRTYDELVALVAQPLRGGDFAERFERLDAIYRTLEAAQTRETEARAQISFWDKLNIFSDTDAERARDAAQAEQDGLRDDLAAQGQAVDRAFDSALASYPPAAVYYQIQGVQAALQRIHARWVVRTYTDSKGKTRTTRRCELSGKEAALTAIERWTATLVVGFGALPDLHECLDAWVER